LVKGLGRSWFGGFGKICAGTGVTLANIFLATASWPLNPVAGASTIASVTLGIGTIAEGLGKLNGEQ